MLPGGKLLTDAPKITYTTTKAGKKIDGVIAKTLTNGPGDSDRPIHVVEGRRVLHPHQTCRQAGVE